MDYRYNNACGNRNYRRGPGRAPFSDTMGAQQEMGGWPGRQPDMRQGMYMMPRGNWMQGAGFTQGGTAPQNIDMRNPYSTARQNMQMGMQPGPARQYGQPMQQPYQQQANGMRRQNQGQPRMRPGGRPGWNNPT